MYLLSTNYKKPTRICLNSNFSNPDFLILWQVKVTVYSDFKR